MLLNCVVVLLLAHASGNYQPTTPQHVESKPSPTLIDLTTDHTALIPSSKPSHQRGNHSQCPRDPPTAQIPPTKKSLYLPKYDLPLHSRRSQRCGQVKLLSHSTALNQQHPKVVRRYQAKVVRAKPLSGRPFLLPLPSLKP